MQMESFGKYLLLEKLAAGGMAEVYLAKSIGANGINKFVAIKRILPQYSETPEFVNVQGRGENRRQFEPLQYRFDL